MKNITAVKEYIRKNDTKFLVKRNITFANNKLSFVSMDFSFLTNKTVLTFVKYHARELIRQVQNQKAAVIWY